MYEICSNVVIKDIEANNIQRLQLPNEVKKDLCTLKKEKEKLNEILENTMTEAKELGKLCTYTFKFKREESQTPN